MENWYLVFPCDKTVSKRRSKPKVQAFVEKNYLKVHRHWHSKMKTLNNKYSQHQFISYQIFNYTSIQFLQYFTTFLNFLHSIQ